MKHQITLVGGQSLPILLGIREFNPDKVHFLFSKESKKRIALIKNMDLEFKSSEYLVDAFDFQNIKTICTKILDKLEKDDQVIFNLTGGTKVMVLAVQALILERKLTGFYINQNNTLLRIPEYSKVPLSTKLSTSDFFNLSGHHDFSSLKISDFSKDDINAAGKIDTFANSSRFKSINSFVRSNYPKDTLPMRGEFTVDSSNKLKCSWSEKNVEVFYNGKSVFSANSPKIRNLFFFGGWWELIVASALIDKMQPSEIFFNVQLSFIADKSADKSEIDILINDNNKLIFIECKSGKVKLEDVNKMRTIKETYGGLVSKSILVTQHLLSDSVKERCDELEIEVFVGMTRQFGNLIKAIKKLNNSASL